MVLVGNRACRNAIQTKSGALFMQIGEEFTPVFRRERLAEEFTQLPELLAGVQVGMGGDVQRAGREIGGATEEHARVFDIVRPLLQELDVLEVVSLSERAFVKFFEAQSCEFAGG